MKRSLALLLFCAAPLFALGFVCLLDYYGFLAAGVAR